jgi:16S rRNA (cytosine967-C5)-methyltransferase
VNPRYLALQVLENYEKTSQNPRRLIGDSYPSSARGFVSELVYGVIRWKLLIDWIIDNLVAKPNRLKRRTRNVIRLGIYQMRYMNGVPEYAAVNETVELAKVALNGMTGLVNRALREYQRRGEDIVLPEFSHDPVRYISIAFSYPHWLVKRWVDAWGVERTMDLCRAGNLVPPITLRTNMLRTSRKDLLEKLRCCGVKCEAGRYASESVVLTEHASFSHTEAWKEGLFFVQDEASMLISQVLSPQPGDIVVDVCAAPGGKSTHVAEMTQNRSRVVALDISSERSKAINENCERLGIEGIEVREHNAVEVAPDLLGIADRVLVDAPCSNTGVIRRHPDIKWNKKQSDIHELAELQFLIASASARYLKRGGALVYSTCSLETEENEEVVERLVRESGDLELDSVTGYMPFPARDMVTRDGLLRSFPHLHGTDGFFGARLIRR